MEKDEGPECYGGMSMVVVAVVALVVNEDMSKVQRSFFFAYMD